MEISGKWAWSTREEVADELWQPNQPDGSGGCAQLNKARVDPDYSFKMDDIPCNLLRQYVCEK